MVFTRSGKSVSPSRDGSSQDDADDDDFDLRGRGSGRRHVARKIPASKVGTSPSKNTPRSLAMKTKVMKRSPSRVGAQMKNPSPKKQRKKSAKMPFQHRFSLHRIRELKLTKQQQGWIIDAGFGSLLSLPNVSLPISLVSFVMKNINTELRQFMLDKCKKIIPFDKRLICNITGVPSGRDPVKISYSADEYEEYQKIREPFKGGVRSLSLGDCKVLVSEATDQTSFLRAFMMLAFGSILAPGTDNCVTPRVLNSLVDVSAIRSLDWAGFILDEFMVEVRKYQEYLCRDEAQDSSSSPYLGSCLLIPAIAYIDHVDTAPATATYTLNYSVPRISHVTNEDFQFIEKVDKSRLQLNAYGRLPFRKTNPYPNPVPLTGYLPPCRPQMSEEDVVCPTVIPEFQGAEDVHPSLQDWLHPPATSSKAPEYPTSVESLPEEYQVILAEHLSLVEKDFDDIVHSTKDQFDKIERFMKDRTKQMMANRVAELVQKVSRLHTEKVVGDLATRMRYMNKKSNFAEKAHSSPAPAGAGKKNDQQSTSAGATLHDESNNDLTFFPPPNPRGEVYEQPSVPPSPSLRVEVTEQPNVSSTFPLVESPNEAIPSPTPIYSKDSTKEPKPSPVSSVSMGPIASPSPKSLDEPTKVSIVLPTNPPEDPTKVPIPSHLDTPPDLSKRVAIPNTPSSPLYVDDIPSFDLFKPTEPEFEGVCVDVFRSPSPSGASNDDYGTGSSTLDKRNRKKRKKLDVGLPEMPIIRNVDGAASKEVRNKYLAKRAFHKGFILERQMQPPPFIDIEQYHITYDEFYDSFKPKGWVSNIVMTLWSRLFNLNCLELFQKQDLNNLIFAFLQLATDS